MKMRYLKSICMIAIAMLLVHCTDDLLEVVPESLNIFVRRILFK
jgi:hypothetical protein